MKIPTMKNTLDACEQAVLLLSLVLLLAVLGSAQERSTSAGNDFGWRFSITANKTASSKRSTANT